MNKNIESSLIFQDHTTDKTIEQILNFLHEQRGFDFSGNRASMVKRRIAKRISAVQVIDPKEYLKYIQKDLSELDELINVLTISVSSFFRDPILFESHSSWLDDIILRKQTSQEKDIRIWSAGCSTGEEPYSVAILLNEQLQNETISSDFHIFATDIDREALRSGEEGVYSLGDVQNVKLGLLGKYFSVEKNIYRINEQIKEKVSFSFFDLLHKRSFSPAESIFGGFDIVLCRNVLIYFNFDFQKIIFKKLYRSLNSGGCLILGESETAVEKYKSKFNKVNNCCKIYRKK